MSALSAAATASLISASRLSVSGLATGLDTDQIIQGLLTIQRKTIENIQAKEDRVLQRQQAFKGIEARLLGLQGQLTQLARPQNGVFDGRSVTTSHKDLVTAAAGSSAVPGVYSLQVNSLAKANQIASQGFASAASAITQGTFDVRTGGATVSITIDGSNNTVQGLANAINNSGADVTATVINDGSGANAQPYRLLLSAKKTGLSQAVTITNNLAADAGSAFKPVFDASFIGAANLDPSYSGTSTPTSNRGPGAFTGASNNTYQFTVVTGGTVGTDNNLQIAYTDSTGANTGIITLNAGDVDTLKTVAQGVQVQFAAGTLIAGQTFAIRGSVPQVQQASDASITIGSGAGALTVQNANNQIDGLFGGLSLNLLGADSNQPVTLTVANDTAKANKAIQDFVAGYNELLKFIDDQVRFDAASGQGGPLLGNRQAIAIQEQIRAAVTDAVAGVKPQMNHLGALGITTDIKGRLAINQGKLDNVLAGGIAGVTLTDVRQLFAFAGSSPNPNIQFITGSIKTKASTPPYQVQVTQAARQASILGANALAASTVLDGANNTLTVSVDGLTANLTLAPGTYTQQALAQQLQAQINGASALTGRQVTVGLDAGKLTITSSSFGSSSTVAVSGGTGLAALGFLGTESNQGLDVAGNYLVHSLVEAAQGAGQFLVGNAANSSTADLQVRVLLTPAQVGAGLTEDLSVTRGVASRLDLALAGLLDPVTGRMHTIDDGFQATIDDFKEQITRQNQIMDGRRNQLLRQFASLEQTVSQLQGIGNFLAAQFAALANNNK